MGRTVPSRVLSDPCRPPYSPPFPGRCPDGHRQRLPGRGRPDARRLPALPGFREPPGPATRSTAPARSSRERESAASGGLPVEVDGEELVPGLRGDPGVGIGAEDDGGSGPAVGPGQVWSGDRGGDRAARATRTPAIRPGTYVRIPLAPLLGAPRRHPMCRICACGALRREALSNEKRPCRPLRPAPRSVLPTPPTPPYSYDAEAAAMEPVGVSQPGGATRAIRCDAPAVGR